jgi:hypothetical protein
MPRLNLQGLDDHFSEEEVWNVIRALPPPLTKRWTPMGSLPTSYKLYGTS